MGATLELRNLPEELTERITRRAALHGRTPEEEVLALLERTFSPKEIITPKQLLAEARAAGIQTPSESVRLVREDRDAR